jgi:hypothetical protein
MKSRSRGGPAAPLRQHEGVGRSGMNDAEFPEPPDAVVILVCLAVGLAWVVFWAAVVVWLF